MQPTHLVHFQSTDNLDLPGLLYEPAQKSTVAAIYLHGNGDSSIFYDADQINAIAKALTDQGIAYFPFNNRGAHSVKKLNKVSVDEISQAYYGSDYELIQECVADINGAISYLETRGYNTFYLIGYSTGANKICVYDHYQPDNKITKYVLISGADDAGLHYSDLGAKGFRDALNLAKGKVAEGKGQELAAGRLAAAVGMMSFQSVWDTLNPDGDYNTFPFGEVIKGLQLSTKPHFNYFAAITRPMSIIYGGDDEYSYGDVPRVLKLLKANAAPGTAIDTTIIPDADHSYTGQSQQLAEAIAASLMPANA